MPSAGRSVMIGSVNHVAGRARGIGRPRASLAAARCRGLRVARGRPRDRRGRRQHARPEPAAGRRAPLPYIGARGSSRSSSRWRYGAALGRIAQVAAVRRRAPLGRGGACAVERIASVDRPGRGPADPLADRHAARARSRARSAGRSRPRRSTPARRNGSSRSARPRRSPATSSGSLVAGAGRGARRHGITRRRAGVLFARGGRAHRPRGPGRRTAQRLGAAAGRPPADRRGRPSRVRRGPQVTAACGSSRSPTCCSRSSRSPSRTRILRAAEAPFPAEAELALRPRHDLGGRDGDLVRRVARRSPTASMPGSASPVPRSLLPLVYVVGFGRLDPAFSFATAAAFVFAQQVDPARPLERRVERVLQRRSRRCDAPRSWRSRTAFRGRSGPSLVGRPAARRRAPARARPGLLAGPRRRR